MCCWSPAAAKACSWRPSFACRRRKGGRHADGADPQPVLSGLFRRGGDGRGRAGVGASGRARPASSRITPPCRTPISPRARAAMAYLCTPANPQGTVASSRERLKSAIRLARASSTSSSISDECYSGDLYRHARRRPVQLGACAALRRRPQERAGVSIPLSKRSSVPGLRAGSVIRRRRRSDRQVLQAARPRRRGAKPMPVMARGNRAVARREFMRRRPTARCHRRQARRRRAHLRQSVRLLSARRRLFPLARCRRRQIARRKRLWRDAGIRVLPGAYLARPDAAMAAQPGAAYIRVALGA